MVEWSLILYDYVLVIFLDFVPFEHIFKMNFRWAKFPKISALTPEKFFLNS